MAPGKIILSISDLSKSSTESKATKDTSHTQQVLKDKKISKKNKIEPKDRNDIQKSGNNNLLADLAKSDPREPNARSGKLSSNATLIKEIQYLKFLNYVILIC